MDQNNVGDIKMNWTHEQLRQLSYTESSPGVFTHSSTAGIPHAKPQPAPRPALVNHCKGKTPRKNRVTLIITRSACSLLDADNFAGGCKPLIDQLRYAKLIADDDPETVEIIFRQVKVATKAEEMTTVEITTQGEYEGEIPNTCQDQF
jgi:hypothetical protein